MENTKKKKNETFSPFTFAHRAATSNADFCAPTIATFLPLINSTASALSIAEKSMECNIFP